jgi:hypothetical protein
VGKRTPMRSNLVKPNLRELTKKSERIKLRLHSRASSVDADTKALFMAIRNVGTGPLASAGWIMAMALTVVPARSSVPLWLKIAASTAREVLANPKSAQAPARTSSAQATPAQASAARASRSRASSLER